MPYKIKKKDGGFAVTTPNHPGGFSKKAQTKAGAASQLRAIMANGGGKERAGWGDLVKGKSK